MGYFCTPRNQLCPPPIAHRRYIRSRPCYLLTLDFWVIFWAFFGGTKLELSSLCRHHYWKIFLGKFLGAFLNLIILNCHPPVAAPPHSPLPNHERLDALAALPARRLPLGHPVTHGRPRGKVDVLLILSQVFLLESSKNLTT